MNIYPSQKVDKATRNSKEWKVNNVRWLVQQTSFYNADKWDLIKEYKAAQGIIDIEEYKYILNPYNSTKENMKQFPAQMRNMDIITPIINLFMGEKSEKPNEITVSCVNADVVSEYQEALNKKYLDALHQDTINKLNQTGVQTGVDSSKEPVDYDKVKEEHDETWQDVRSQQGQATFDFLKYKLDLEDRYQVAFYDALATNRYYTYKDINKNDLDLQIVSPLEMWHGSSSTNMVEDAAWCARKTRMNGNDIIDRFTEFLSNGEKSVNEGQNISPNDQGSDIDYINTLMKNEVNITSDINQMANIDNRGGNREMYALLEPGLLNVFHVCWKTFIKIGYLKYIDEFGMQQELQVDEDYILDKEHGDISIEWEYINEVWEGWQIHDRILEKSIRPILAQRNELTNCSKCKLPYNGRIDKRPSLVKTLLPYQALYNIYHYRSELTLARNKDKIMLMPKGLIPEGWDADKWMYFAEATGIGWFDETKPNAAMVLSALKAIDMGLGNYVQEMRALFKDIKAEAWDAIGMNRQRYGDVNSSDGKGNNEQAVMRSSIMSREFFRKFQKFEESDAQGLIDYSKVAWKDGKRGAYVSDGILKTLDINPSSHLEADYAIFARNSDKEYENLKQAKQVAFAIAQKGTTPGSTALEIIDGNNMSKIKTLVKKLEDVESQLQQDQAKGQQEHEKEIEGFKNQLAQLDSQTKIKVAEINAHATLSSAMIGNQGQDQPQQEEDTSIDDYMKQNTANLENIRKESFNKAKLNLEAGKHGDNVRLKEGDQMLKKQDIENKLKIAKQNKNKYDK